jgi:hypothetical protein
MLAVISRRHFFFVVDSLGFYMNVSFLSRPCHTEMTSFHASLCTLKGWLADLVQPCWLESFTRIVGMVGFCRTSSAFN